MFISLQDAYMDGLPSYVSRKIPTPFLLKNGECMHGSIARIETI